MNLLDYMRLQQEERAARAGILPMQPRMSPAQERSVAVSQGETPQPVMPIERPRAAPMMMGQPRIVGPLQTGGYTQGTEAFGPPMPSEYQVAGYTKGLGSSMPGQSAQDYANQFAGGDLSKVQSRLINIDGQMVNDFYTRGLLDGPMPQGPVAPDASSGGFGPPQPDMMDKFKMWLGGLLGGGN